MPNLKSSSEIVSAKSQDQLKSDPAIMGASGRFVPLPIGTAIEKHYAHALEKLRPTGFFLNDDEIKDFADTVQAINEGAKFAPQVHFRVEKTQDMLEQSGLLKAAQSLAASAETIEEIQDAEKGLRGLIDPLFKSLRAQRSNLAAIHGEVNVMLEERKVLLESIKRANFWRSENVQRAERMRTRIRDCMFTEHGALEIWRQLAEKHDETHAPRIIEEIDAFIADTKPKIAELEGKIREYAKANGVERLLPADLVSQANIPEQN